MRWVDFNRSLRLKNFGWVGGGGQGPIYPFMALTIELEIGTVSQT